MVSFIGFLLCTFLQRLNRKGGAKMSILVMSDVGKNLLCLLDKLFPVTIWISKGLIDIIISLSVPILLHISFLFQGFVPRFQLVNLLNSQLNIVIKVVRLVGNFYKIHLECVVFLVKGLYLLLEEFHFFQQLLLLVLQILLLSVVVYIFR